MQNPTTIKFPPSFNPDSYDTIPYSRYPIFEGEESNDGLEKAARTAIRERLEKKLGKPVVSRDCLNHRFGLKKAGYSQDDILSGKVLVR